MFTLESHGYKCFQLEGILFLEIEQESWLS